MSKHWECKYCDRPAGYMGIPIKVENEPDICVCGAEWEDAKIFVEDEELDFSEFKDDYEDDYEDFDLYD